MVSRPFFEKTVMQKNLNLVFCSSAIFFLLWGCVPKVKKKAISGKNTERDSERSSRSPAGEARPSVGSPRTAKHYSQGSGDTLLTKLLWYLDKDKYTTQTASVDINLSDVHLYYRGEGQVVIVSDNRVDLDHPDLQANANVNLSKDYTAGIDNSAWLGKMPRNVKTNHAHGTFVAGEIAMVKDNSEGMFGVAPNVELRGYNFLGSDQKYSKLIDNLGVGVKGNATFNYSFGSFQSSFTGFGEYAESYLQYLSEKRPGANIVWVKASGNWYLEDSKEGIINWRGQKWFLGNSNFDQINTYPYMIMVGALNTSGKRASFSSPGSNLWVSAPGTRISASDIPGCGNGYGTSSSMGPFDRQGNNLNSTCDYATYKQGTSYAAPLVSGVVALLREVCPNTCTWREIKHVLAKTAVKVDARASDQNDHPIRSLSLPGHVYQLGWRTNSAGYSFHNHYGFGGVDVKAAINYLENEAKVMGELFSTLGQDGMPYYQSGSLDQAIPDSDASGTSHSITVDAHNLVIEHVLVIVNITHPIASDLGIELTSPSGMVSQLANINSGINQVDLTNDVHFGSNAFYGESSLGTWTLKVVDGRSGESGVLKDWSLKIMGHQSPHASITEPLGIVSAGLDSRGNLSWVLPSGASSLRRLEVCILDKDYQCGPHDWFSLPPVSSEFQVSHYKSYTQHGLWMPIDAGIKKVKIRVVDNDENVSPTQSYDFDF